MHLSRRIPPWTAVPFLCAALLAACSDNNNTVTAPSSPLFLQTNLVADSAGHGAAFVDPNLKNPWGIAINPSNGVLWIANNHSGLSTVYGGDGSIKPIVVSVLKSDGNMGGAPTGIVFNTTNTFAVGGTKPLWIFSTEDGDIATWNAGTTVARVAASRAGAAYLGLALSSTAIGSRLYAADFANNRVDMFDSNYQYISSFTDSGVPSGYGPFNVTSIGDSIYVAFAKIDPASGDEEKGAGNGFVSIFTPAGNLVKRFASNGALNAPWAIVRAPSTFGSYAGDILVGNFGDGRINIYGPSGAFIAPLMSAANAPIAIDGLWGLAVAQPNTVYFAAGINDEENGLIGKITAR